MLTILQNFLPSQKELRELALAAHEDYAKRRGYVHQVTELTAPNGLSQSWVKIFLLAAWAAEAKLTDEALWIDPEALIVRNEELSGLIGGRDLGMAKMDVSSYQWYATDTIFARKRSDKLKSFFDLVLTSGPIGRDETLPCSRTSETGRVNQLLPASSLNVFSFPPEYNGNIAFGCPDPIIQCWRGGHDIINSMKARLGRK